MNNSIPTTQTSRPHRRGFTLAELATAMGLALAIAVMMMTLLQQQVTLHGILKAQGFLVDDAPQINNTITQILSRADAYRIHENLSDAVAGANAVTEDGKVLVLGFLNPDGSEDFGIVSFETNDGKDELAYYNLNPSVPFTKAGNPDWLISRRVENAEFFIENGVFRMELTGPAGESITYSGTPRL